ncbi:MAG: PH domain-containing protein [Christensenellales bacterium]
MKVKHDFPKYKSKIGIIVPVVYLALAVGILIIWLVPNMSIKDTLGMKIAGTCVIALAIILFTWAVFSTYYVLTPDGIYAFSGPFTMRVKYSDITKIEERKSCLSSLALSCDRIIIHTKKSFLRLDVSPKDKEKFLEDLNENLKYFKNR